MEVQEVVMEVQEESLFPLFASKSLKETLFSTSVSETLNPSQFFLLFLYKRKKNLISLLIHIEDGISLLIHIEDGRLHPYCR